jgi:hypothetical protein
MLYTSLAGADTKAFSSAFEKANPGVKWDIYHASGTTILQRVLTESRAGADLVDAVMTEGTVLHALKDKICWSNSTPRSARHSMLASKTKRDTGPIYIPLYTRFPITQSS